MIMRELLISGGLIALLFTCALLGRAV